MRLDEIFSPMRTAALSEAKPAGHTNLADKKTGFYGSWGAGCLLMDQTTGEFLIAFRSNNPPPWHVEQPHEWGTFGGSAKISDQNPLGVAKRELAEETEYRGPFIEWLPLYVFKSGSFSYYNFLGIVPKKFSPTLNWENDDTAWVPLHTLLSGRIPPHSNKPIHFGLKAILTDAASLDTLKKAASQAEQTLSKLDEPHDTRPDQPGMAAGLPGRLSGQPGNENG